MTQLVDLERCGSCKAPIGDAGLVRQGALLVCADGCQNHKTAAGGVWVEMSRLDDDGERDEEVLWRGDSVSEAIAFARTVKYEDEETEHLSVYRRTPDGRLNLIWADGIRVASHRRTASEDSPAFVVHYWRPGQNDDPESLGFDQRGDVDDYTSMLSQDGYEGEVTDAGGGVLYDFQTTGARKVAHDSGDGETIYHCPFCGSGQVTGRSDGTAICGFCTMAFTVQVQPEYPSMPQTVNGQPVNDPSMPGDPTQRQDEVDVVGDPDEGQENPFENNSQEGAPPKDNPFTSGLRTARGVRVDEDDYLAHLALQVTPDRQRTLTEIRQVRRR